jgi:hypothetical protein
MRIAKCFFVLLGASSIFASAGCSAKRTAPCAAWTTDATGGGVATSSAGVLVLTFDNSPNTQFGIRYFRTVPLTGDFEINITFDSFVSGGPGAIAHVFAARDPDPNNTAVHDGGFASIGDTFVDSLPGLGAAVLTTTTAVINHHTDVSATSGSFLLSRAGNVFTATATAGGASTSASDVVDGEPVQLGFELENVSTTVSGSTSIRFTDVQGGGCNGF